MKSGICLLLLATNHDPLAGPPYQPLQKPVTIMPRSPWPGFTLSQTTSCQITAVSFYNPACL